MSVLFQKLKKKASMEKDGEDPGGLVSPLGRKKSEKQRQTKRNRRRRKSRRWRRDVISCEKDDSATRW